MTASGTLDWTSYHNTVNGQAAKTAKTRHGINPATEEALPEVPVATQEDVDAAVDAARAAFPAWSKTSWDERQALVNKLVDAVEANQAGFVDMLVKETGKAVSTSGMEFGSTLKFGRALAALRVEDKILVDSAEMTGTLRYTPLGIGAAIVPWNWPLLLATIKLVSGLITGNCVIVKPSPFTPYTNLKLVELASGIFPPGVAQALSGGDDLGPMLTEHPGIDKVSFTGSSFTGKKVMASCARTLKRVTLELGGNDVAIICDDADLAKAVPTVATMAFLGSGQICMDVKRIYVHEKVYEPFKTALIDFAKAIKMGNPEDPTTLVGPIQNAMQYGKVQEMFSQIKKEGWNAIVGGAPDARDVQPKGYFMHPTIIDNPPEDSRIVQEEPFGPIVPLLKWSDEEDVLARANSSKMGLGGSVWSKDTERGTRLAKRLECGSSWVNTHFHLDPNVPFGGAKWSGLGRELGVTGLEGWMEPQSLWVSKA
ncbi:NAD-dependent aldehyde dehydrogenase [Cutaneotrichosporon oleaginosum]|uniref:NAD-dependent aldehyde dehydrogenase n=1 Tax=Cutaneotrichosporon oleaginosum TaxID=879819 RepID=A0A0J0XUJ7_9TREE|nr:NAD-dependent aldehyde dehydrogenase [Cutaneotrichosporon oleaginosum]KLT44753.1 NAD-dependent aldehyde dehydrogenase [Cutaneotrichosporon oleaginosum]TXT07739.1 hypothetical protein COLE_04663 [Cutaneotrichosporon oleaginosum]